MPKPHKGEKKKDFISRCIPILIDEGKEKDQAVAICFSFWERKDEATELIIDKVLNEQQNYVVMFFDPSLDTENTKDKTRKNTLVVGKVVNDKLQIVDGEVWQGGHLIDEVIPEVADVVKKWKPQIVFVEDNYFQRVLKKSMEDYNIPFKGVMRKSDKIAIEMTANDKNIEWKINKNKDMFFGAGSLLMVLKKMKKLTESTVVADVVDKDMPVEDKPKKKKCKKSKKFKEELMKEDA